MNVSPLAGKLPPANILIDVDRLTRQYYNNKPDLSDPRQIISFGTSGHRGTPEETSFNEPHILAITQAVCEYRASKGIDGPLFLAKDTHAACAPAFVTALEVLAGNEVEVIIASNDDFTPVPIVSFSVLAYNKGRTSKLADALILTPSHNPPRDGGLKYNPPTGGPADVDITKWIQDRANLLLRNDNKDVKRVTYERAFSAPTTHRQNLIQPYVQALSTVIDMDIIRSSNLRIGADPLGGASVHIWHPIAEYYKLNLTVVNPLVDATFRFLCVDSDGLLRMDCSSPYAMAGLVQLKDKYQIAFGNDTDADRHGIVTPSVGLLPPNHFLAVCAKYLFSHRPDWPANAMIGKTLVSSSVIDRVAKSLHRNVYEVPVGFKWFVNGLVDGTLGFVGEESAGATLLRKDGSAWTTDKDGPVLDLLACEITARTNKDPGLHYAEIEAEHGKSYYKREDQPCSLKEKSILSKLTPTNVTSTSIAGENIINVLTTAPGNNASIGGLKVTTENGWFAARPSGTENVYKIYAESLKSDSHLNQIITQARDLVKTTLSQAVA